MTGREKVYVYIPAFSLARMVVQNLGVRLTQRQPILDLTLGGLGPGSADSSSELPPVLIGRREARLLSEFVYVALGVWEGHRHEVAGDEVEVEGEELLLIPAIRDPRCIHDAGWRLLLREFDL